MVSEQISVFVEHSLKITMVAMHSDCFRKQCQYDKFWLSLMDEFLTHVSSLNTEGTSCWTQNFRASSGSIRMYLSQGAAVFLDGMSGLTEEDFRETEA